MKNIFILLCLVCSLFAFAQDEKHCGQNEAMRRLYEKMPYLKEKQKQAFNKLQFNNSTYNQTRIIPVVFHVMHVYGGENISDEQVEDAVRILNEDFQARNADTSLIVPAFKNVKGNPMIEFRLAKLDPEGNCTNGINHVYSELTNTGEDDVKYNQWDPGKYLNIWTVKSISFGAAGYAYYPSTADGWPDIDGIVILADYVGSIGSGVYSRARALTHEVGHYFELQHVWGDTNDPGVACGDDEVFDTPITKGWTGCNPNGSICTPGVIENVQNYMEYAYCSRMYTQGQSDRMQGVLNSNIASRNNLWSAQNLLETGTDDNHFFNANPCKPIADFKTDKSIICNGSSIQFTDISSNAPATNWYWEFEGGLPSTSTDQNPLVQYNVPGVYQVKFKSSNNSGADSILKYQYISVLNGNALYQNNYVEGFENFNQTQQEIAILNEDAVTFNQANTGATGNSSIVLRNSQVAQNGGQVDAFITPGIDVSSIPTPTLSFKVAYAQYSSSTDSKLRVYVSSNCGLTWYQRYLKSGDNLSTAPNQSGSFVPNETQWRTELVSINNVLNSNNVLVKFEYTNGAGNNLYIDDINLYSNITGVPTESLNSINIYPNPAYDWLHIDNLKNYKELSVEIYDMPGKKILSNTYTSNTGSIALDLKSLSTGLYIVELTNSSGSVSRLITIE